MCTLLKTSFGVSIKDSWLCKRLKIFNLIFKLWLSSLLYKTTLCEAIVDCSEHWNLVISCSSLQLEQCKFQQCCTTYRCGMNAGKCSYLNTEAWEWESDGWRSKSPQTSVKRRVAAACSMYDVSVKRRLMKWNPSAETFQTMSL